jgi:hypothetical protein
MAGLRGVLVRRREEAGDRTDEEWSARRSSRSVVIRAIPVR